MRHYLRVRIMRPIVTIVLYVSLAGVVCAQEAAKPPVCNPDVIQKTLSDLPKNPEGLIFKQRFCIYARQLVTVEALAGATIFSGVAQFRDDPVEWGQGASGYARRFGTRYSQGVAKTTGDFVVGSLLKEDPRYEASRDTNFWKRTGHAFASIFVVKNVYGNQRPAFSKFAGAASSGLVGLAWYPDRLNRPGDVAARIGTGFGGYLASSVFQEFKPNLLRGLKKMFGSKSKATTEPQASPDPK